MKKILIFGTGKHCSEYTAFSEPPNWGGHIIVGYLDNDERKWDKEKRIFPPNTLYELEYDYVVIATLAYALDVYRQLLSMECPVYKIAILGRTNKIYPLIDNDRSKLKVLNETQTLDLLLSDPKSFYRFGDGEIDIITGHSIPFQKYDPKLADLLLQALIYQGKNVYIGLHKGFLDYDVLNIDQKSHQSNREKKEAFWMNTTYRGFMQDYCSKDVTYISAAFNQRYFYIKESEMTLWFEKVKKLFANRRMVVFLGEGIRKKLQYDVFDLAEDVTYVEGPSKDAFDQYDTIKEEAKQHGKDKLLCFILGPASKVLVYELAQEGYIAWDLGHLPKDYNSFMLHLKKTENARSDFYAPDC